MIEGLLQELGLSDKEQKAYLTLLQYGTRPTSFIAQKSKLNRGTAYVALHTLLRMGLASKTTRNKVQYFSALDPKQLIHFVERRTEELAATKEKLTASLGEFYRIINPLRSTPTFQLFDGIDGARAALEDTLTCGEQELCAFLSIADIQEFAGAEYFMDYTLRRVKSGIALRALRTYEKDKKAFEKFGYSPRFTTSTRDKRIVRHVSEDLAFPISMYIYDDKLTLISSKEENYALIIRSRELCSMQRKLFELIWSQARTEERACARS